MEIIKEVVRNNEVFSYGLEGFDFVDDKFKSLNSTSVLKIKTKDELKSMGVDLSDSFLDKISGCSFDVDALVVITYIQSEGKYFGKVEDEEANTNIDILADWCEVSENSDGSKLETFDLISSLSEDELNEIINEMISKISDEELKATLSIINCAYGRNSDQMDEKIANKYITTWAKNKAFMYLAMGRNLIIEKDVVVQCTDQDLKNQWQQKCDNFLFGVVLQNIKKEDIANNSVILDDFYSYFINTFGESRCDCVEFRRLNELINRNKSNTKMKLTKVISKVFEDEKLNIELSKVLQGRAQRHSVKMSIHPLDYLTCSIAKKWQSCHRPTGMYQGGPISYMLDSATVMTYSSSDEMLISEAYNADFSILFDDGWKSFKWNNKTWRSLFYVNNKNFSATFYREYPSPLGNMFDVVRLWYEELISNYLNKENVWEDRNMYYHLNDVCSLHYNDPIHFRGATERDKHLHHVSLPNVKYDDIINVGHMAFNLDDGRATSNKFLQ